MKCLLLIIYIVILFNVNIYAQDNGIQFDQTSTWQQLLSKAQREKKHIFLDFYATWCGPCKAMDKNVYGQKQVGDAVNKDFISVKVQIDTSQKDDIRTQQWYADAKKLYNQYNIIALPTFIFLTSDGQPLHKGYGYYSKDDFINLILDAKDPNKQYYTQITKFRKGLLNIKSLPNLAKQTQEFGDKKLSVEIAKEYKTKYLDNLSLNELSNKENLDFLNNNWNILSSKDVFFKLCYNTPAKIDSIFKDDNISKNIIQYIITKEEIDDKIFKENKLVNKNPNWDNFESNIRKKYPKSDAKNYILDAQLRFYEGTENWEKFAVYRDKKLAIIPLKEGGGLTGDAWKLNTDAWNVFLNCTDKHVLIRALSWSNLSIKRAELDNDNVLFAYYDTKASILYKLGQTDEAILIEQKAIDIAKSKGEGYDEFAAALEGMKNNQPIYNAKWLD